MFDLLKKKDKRGVMGLDTVEAVIGSLLVLTIFAFAAIIAWGNLVGNTGLTAGSIADNATTNILNNATKATANFFQQMPTVFTILGIVVLILAVILIVVAVQRIRSPTGGAVGL